MTKLFVTFATVLMTLATARCTNSKFVKTMPTITNSLVNLGKMEVSFYFSGKRPEDTMKPENERIPFLENFPFTMNPEKERFPFLDSFPFPRSHAMEASCPCSDFKSPKESFLPNPSDLINKILRSKDLFKDPTSSLCCESHEEVQESTIFFDFQAPTNNIRNPFNSMKFPSPLKKILHLPSRQLGGQTKTKDLEIFLFPKLKDIASMAFTKMATTPVVSKAEIQIVGDKEIKPLNDGASIKKDLTKLTETDENEDALKVEEPVTIVSNAL